MHMVFKKWYSFSALMSLSTYQHIYEELSECLTCDLGVAGSSLNGGTVLSPWVRHFILCNPQKYPDMTEKL